MQPGTQDKEGQCEASGKAERVSMRGLGVSGGAGTASKAGEPVSVCCGLQEDARLLARSQREHRLRPGSHDSPGGGTAQRPRSVCMPVRSVTS